MRQAAVQTLNAGKAKVTLSKPTLDIYNDGERFAIVSRDDRFPAVLAYGVGNFDIDKAPENVKWWFEAVQRSMDKAVKENKTRRVPATYTPVEPFVTTKWGQSAPFNNYCPVFEDDNTKAPTGCVATAMAQIINYRQYPTSVKFEGSYMIGEKEKTALVESTYSFPFNKAYGNYLPTADSDVEYMSYTPLQGNRVATLMRDCGYAIDMNYDAKSSGGYTFMAGAAFVEKFNYPKESVKYVSRYYYSDEEWMDMVYAELQNGTPVLYAGSTEKSGGHAFVFHGMDADGLVFVNWGWSGIFDGYYAIDVLTPGADDFSDKQEMVIGVRPTPLPTDIWCSSFATILPYVFTYDNETQILTLTWSEGIFNISCSDFYGQWGIVVEDVNNPENTGWAELFEEPETIEFFTGFSGEVSGTFEFDPGTYHIYLATVAAGETNWQYVRTVGGAIYYDLTVDANGIVTLAETPTFTTGQGTEGPEIPVPTAIKNIIAKPAETTAPVRYFDLQGREVSGSTKGLLIRKHGDEVQKVLVK